MGLIKEFRDFLLRGSVVDLAVGFIVGAAFTSLVNSLVSDVLMPPLDLLVRGVDFSSGFVVLRAGELPPPYPSLGAAREAGAVTLNYGLFLDELVTFVLVGLAVFLVVRTINRLERRRDDGEPASPTTKECPFCISTVPVRAVRCPACTAELPEGA